MKIKHKIIKDFPYISPDKKITLLKSGTIIEDFIYRTKTESILIDRDVVNSNADYFQSIDWKQDLLTFMKQSKVPQPAVIGRKIIPFIESIFVMSMASQVNSSDVEKEYKAKLEEMKDKEVILDKENKNKRRELDELERNLETKLTQMEIELEKKYRSKMKEVSVLESEMEKKVLDSHRNANTTSDTNLQLELENLQRQFQLKELEIQKIYEVKLTTSQVELEKQYREKLLEVMEKESDLEIKSNRLTQRQLDYESSMKKLSTKEQDIRESLEQIANKQDSLREFEYELSQRERDMDKNILKNSEDLDIKQKELNEKLELKLLELDTKESEINNKSEELNQKEAQMYDEFGDKIKEYESQYNEKLEELKRREKEALLTNYDKIKHIEKLVNEYHTEIPWYHNQMWETKSKLEEIIKQFKSL